MQFFSNNITLSYRFLILQISKFLFCFSFFHHTFYYNSVLSGSCILKINFLNLSRFQEGLFYPTRCYISVLIFFSYTFKRRLIFAMIISTTRDVFIRGEISVYFSLELPISEENRSIHDNFTESFDGVAYFPRRRRGSVRVVVVCVLCGIIRAGTRERRERSAIGRTKKTH